MPAIMAAMLACLSGRGRERRVQRWIRGARFPAGARQKVRHAGLVCQHQVGDDVARERAIAIRVEQTLHRREFATGASVERGGVITHVLRRTGAAGHEPAAKPLSSADRSDRCGAEDRKTAMVPDAWC